MANILKEANTEIEKNSVSMYTRLTQHKYGATYRRSCRNGLLKSIYTKDGGQGSDGQSANRVQAPITVLMCFCQLGGGFDTDVIFQDSSYLVDGDVRVKRSGDVDIFNTHEFNNHGIGMCKEFRRGIILQTFKISNVDEGSTDKREGCTITAPRDTESAQTARPVALNELNDCLTRNRKKSNATTSCTLGED